MKNIINKSEIYYVYNIVDKKLLVELEGKEELISWFARSQRLEKSWYDNDYNNNYLNNLNMSFQDTYLNCDGVYLISEGVYLIRKYMVLDGYNRIVDVRKFYKEILNEAKKAANKSYSYNRGTWYISSIQRYVGKGYKGAKYRQEPVPFTNKKGRYSCCIRLIKTTNEARQNSDKEIKEYIRPSRAKKNLPNSWDEITRHIEKSWKSQRKCKKQWMKNLK